MKLFVKIGSSSYARHDPRESCIMLSFDQSLQRLVEDGVRVFRNLKSDSSEISLGVSRNLGNPLKFPSKTYPDGFFKEYLYRLLQYSIDSFRNSFRSFHRDSLRNSDEKPNQHRFHQISRNFYCIFFSRIPI